MKLSLVGGNCLLGVEILRGLPKRSGGTAGWEGVTTFKEGMYLSQGAQAETRTLYCSEVVNVKAKPTN